MSDTLLTQLAGAVEKLAAPADEQIAYLDKLGVLPSIDEIGLEFDDVAAAGLSASSGLSASQRDAVGQLDLILRDMSTSGRENLWTPNALRSDSRWEVVRATARRTLSELRAK